MAAIPPPEDDRTPLDDLEEVSEQIDQWEAGLKNQPGEPSARIEIRNWLLPILRRFCGIIDGVATDLVEELDERVDEVSGLARAVAGTAGITELLANVHHLCQRILAADLGEETQEMAAAIQEMTAGHYAAVAGAQAQRAAAEAPVPIVVPPGPGGTPVTVVVPSPVTAGGFSGVITTPTGTVAPSGDVIPAGSFDTPAAA